MATKKSKKTELTTQQQVGIGVGLTTAAVAAAGAYFLYGSEKAAKNRAAVKSWSLKAKAEVLEHLEDAKKMSRVEFEEVVAGVAAGYAGVKAASKKDIKGFAEEMMTYWDKLEASMEKKKKLAAKELKAKKEAKKEIKKIAKK